MIHAHDPIATRCVVPHLDCCHQPDHVRITCPTCDNSPSSLQVGRMSPPEWAECPRCEGAGSVFACRACGTVDCAGTDPRDCTDWDGEDVALAAARE